MRKILLFMVVLCIFNTQIFASGSPSAKQSYLTKNFTASTTSNYDPMDVFGILTFLMQSYGEEIIEWNYEFYNLTWDDMVVAINGNPDIVFNKCGAFGFDLAGNTKVLTQVRFESRPLTGIFDGKYFKNLRDLAIINTQITALDVSKNPNLTKLTCVGNSLTTLNVSKNTKLTDLECFNNYLLTSLDVSNNPDLYRLNCMGNQLTSLNISNSPDLYWLNCSDNKLTSLDLSKNSNLQWLICALNPLITLDVSKNTNLQTLVCAYNQLSSLNISNNTKLETLICAYTLESSEDYNLVKLINKLKFSTLKGDFSKFNETNSILSPQALLEGGTKGFFELIDLSSEYNINGTLTTFKWYDKATNQEVTVFAANGTFYAGPTNAGKTLICKMTNTLYPDLTLEYEVTITNAMTQSFSAKTTDFKIPDGFTLTGPEAESSNLKVYPNPVTDVLKITTPSKIESVVVYDYSGREVKRMSSVTNNEINLQGLATGNYILTIQTPQGTSTKKIIKK